jgi:DNA-binding response OmpR family regulator
MIALGSKGAKQETGKRVANLLSGKIILVVEDEFLLALQLEELVESLGGRVRGPYRSLDRAMEARREDFDLAILDINLGGAMVYPLADDLAERGVPFIFLSGYSGANLPERFRSVTRLSKPCDPDALIAVLQSHLP